ncbi:lipoamide acyltransferase component ofbranched-chain alpha-keto acid dehydrogenase [Striga asiatica]|uniref:Lipoamide acyltransferase component ofbranched-chain alpha-keto acid dehydrogenase n=1 Tax=Striga asiatica TaxID=4170 RepID=A0A5A7RL43_STRAF|nr:lipoamide acyltransferase component ofbranched-chain alpha-keto acid dehydrogenase [Striga asiatica]
MNLKRKKKREKIRKTDNVGHVSSVPYGIVTVILKLLKSASHIINGLDNIHLLHCLVRENVRVIMVAFQNSTHLDKLLLKLLELKNAQTLTWDMARKVHLCGSGLTMPSGLGMPATGVGTWSMCSHWGLDLRDSYTSFTNLCPSEMSWGGWSSLPGTSLLSKYLGSITT